jgi:hypothetical protein
MCFEYFQSVMFIEQMYLFLFVFLNPYRLDPRTRRRPAGQQIDATTRLHPMDCRRRRPLAEIPYIPKEKKRVNQI